MCYNDTRAKNIPVQLYTAQSTTGGRLGESMSNVIVKENESLDSALRRFKRNCAKAGLEARENRVCYATFFARFAAMSLKVKCTFL